MKRIISVLLAAAILIACSTTAAYAEGETGEGNIEDTVYTKLTPAAREALESYVPGFTPDWHFNLWVYLADEPKAVSDMPSWPDPEAATEYSDYLYDRNSKLFKNIFLKNPEDRYNSFGNIEFRLPGCLLAYGCTDPGAIGILVDSDEVRLIDTFDTLADYCYLPRGKGSAELEAVVNSLDADDYITVVFGNNDEIKTVADMPSWPKNDSNSEEDIINRNKAREEYSEYVKEISDAYISETLNTIDAYWVSGQGYRVYAAVRVKDIGLLGERENITYIDCDKSRVADAGIRVEPYEPIWDYYRSKLVAQYQLSDDMTGNLVRFKEEYYHIVYKNGEPDGWDWILVSALDCSIEYCSVLYDSVVGGRTLSAGAWPYSPFLFGYGIFDMEQDRFFDLTEIDFDDYDGLYDLWKDYQIDSVRLGVCESSVHIGDADGDSDVSILDATRIQRYLAELCKQYDIALKNRAPDGDGEVSILDATRIQRDLAYLDDTPEPPEPTWVSRDV